MNPIYLTDSYKVAHAEQYPPKTTSVYSYFESRGGAFPETVFAGLQGILSSHLVGRVLYRSHIEAADKLLRAHFGRALFNREGWLHILHDHHGRIPLRVRAVREGSVVPTHNVLMTAENTCPQCWWVTNYFESLLVQTWYPTTVATISREAKKIIMQWLDQTGDPSGVDFKLHDFGFRGVSSPESAAIGGCAHLMNFLGTDNVPALVYAGQHYDEPCAGYSVPASEHSTMTSWGGPDFELDAMRNMLDIYGDGIVACVSDSYDLDRACREYWGTALRDRVLSRDGVLVVRPDSGYPPAIVCETLETLGRAFGYGHNNKGYKVLDPHVRVIQGDGCNLPVIDEVLRQMAFHGWSADNLTFGMGGALLQKCDRDTQKFAFKCSHVTVDGVERDVWKDPATDAGKRSKRGRLALTLTPTGYQTVPYASATASGDELQDVFLNGLLLNRQSLSDIRHRATVAAKVCAQ